MIKYIIWGAGLRGKRALDFIGRENVVAFIDKNPELQKKGFCDVPVIDFTTYKIMYLDNLLIISFQEYKDAVEKLEQFGIYSFLLLEDVLY